MISRTLRSLGPVLGTLLICSPLFNAVVVAEETRSTRPNILWITCEDISPHLGCYGDPRAITPNLDRLASQGVLYRNAFSIAGVCAPTRSCIITGMYPTSIGSQHMRSKASLPSYIRCFTENLREAGYYCTNNVKTDYNFNHPKSAWDESSRRAHWRNRRDGQPFFAVFNFTITHESKVRANDKTFAGLTSRLTPEQRQDSDRLQFPPYYPDTPRTRKDWAHNYELITAMDLQVADILAQLEEDGLVDNTVVFYYSDHGVGLPRAKRWLYDSGLRVPMMVRWPGKLNPGTIDDRLVSFVDLAPTVLSLAGVNIPDHLQGRPFLGEQAAAPRDYIYAARDRMDERYDIIRAVRDKRYKYIRNYEWFKPYDQNISYAERGPTMQELRRLHASGELNSVQELFFRETKPFEELYDLQSDPHEIHNLADSAGHRKVLSRMRAAHLQWASRTLDTGLLPEPILNQFATDEGLYAVVRNSSSNIPFERIRATANLSTKGTSALPQLTQALDDDDPAVRYWAVVGLNAIDARTATSALQAALKDNSPTVRIVAADALCRFGKSQMALPFLAAALTNDNQFVRILAAYTLDNLGETARPLLPKLQSALEDKNNYVVRLATHAVEQLR